jgi:hypothetical protein
VQTRGDVNHRSGLRSLTERPRDAPHMTRTDFGTLRGARAQPSRRPLRISCSSLRHFHHSTVRPAPAVLGNPLSLVPCPFLFTRIRTFVRLSPGGWEPTAGREFGRRRRGHCRGRAFPRRPSLDLVFEGMPFMATAESLLAACILFCLFLLRYSFVQLCTFLPSLVGFILVAAGPLAPVP